MNGWSSMFNSQRRAALCGAAFMLAGGMSALAGGVADFPLSKAVPADAFLALHTRGTDGHAFLDKQMARVWQAVEAQRFDRDIKRMLKQMNSNGEPPAGAADAPDDEQFEKLWQQFNDLASGVNWSTLGKREYAMCMKISFPTTEMVSMMKPPADTIAKDFEGLSAALKTLAGLQPDVLVLSTDGEGEKITHRISVQGSPFPISITLARVKDTLLVGFGSGFVEQALALLGGGEGATLASGERFTAAAKRIPADPIDTLVFCDMDRMFRQIRDMTKQAFDMGAQYSGEDPEAKAEIDRIQKMVARALDSVDMMEYSISFGATDGLRTSGQEVTVLRATAKEKALYPALFGNGPVQDALKYVPKSASGVSVTSGVNLLSLYNEVLKFIREEVPGGEEQLAFWDNMQEGMQFNLDKDLLSWLHGSMVQFSIAGATQFSRGETVFMLRVKDDAKARASLDRLFSEVEPMLAENNGAIRDAEIAGADGFRSVAHPMIAMMGMKAPTLGIKDGWLMFGSSTEVLGQTFEVAAGKGENFSANERYQKEGVPVTDKVTAFSFTDQTRMGEELGQALQLMTMGIRMGGGAEISRNPAVSSALTMLGKVGKVLKTLDFLQSSSSASTFDGKEVVTRSIWNYREPPAKAAAETTSEDGSR